MRDEGYHVVLDMDANNDVRDGAVSAALADIRILEAVVSNHKGKRVPVTCTCNTQRKPINSIWSSPRLQVLRCGFLPFYEYYGFDSDHRLIWVELYSQSLHGQRPQQIHCSPSTKIKFNNPENRDRYIEKVLEKYELEGINEDYFNLKQFIMSQRAGIDMREGIVFLDK